jgi:hypothetical protein
MKPYHNVRQADGPAPLPIESLPIRHERHFWKKLGIYNIWMVIVGSCAILAAIAFLAFVWAGADQAIHGLDPPPLWYSIINRGWTTRVVTISSALIRLATAAQLGVFAAIMAALILETMGVSVAEFPLLSMIRCVNNGPQSLFWNVLSSILVVIAILNALALQFTSTILLVDFGSASVVLGQNSTEIVFGMKYSDRLGNTQTYLGIDFWKTGPTSYPRFAEYRDEAYKADGYVDTGRTYRAYLPFTSPEERSTLRSFTGVTTVLDARVICVVPSLENLSPRFVSNSLSLIGSLGWADGFPGLRKTDSYDGGFNCSVPLPEDDGWSISLCRLGSGIGDIAEGIKTDHDPAFGVYTEACLLFNSTGTSDVWRSALAGSDIDMDWAQRGPWVYGRHADVGLDVTLCFTNPLPFNYLTEMRGTVDRPEPTLGWDSTSGSYLTRDIRHMLGATSEELTYQERGVLQLKPASNWTARQADVLYNLETLNFIWQGLEYGFGGQDGATSNTTVVLSPHTPATWKSSVHRSHGIIVQHILEATKNPALALQALFTILTQMSYSDFLPQFDVSAPTKYATSSNILMPVQWTGFGVVMGLLLLHFALVLVTVIMFLISTELSLLGNAWQSVAQVASKDTAELIHHASTLTDGEVKRLLEMSGIPDGRLLVKRSFENGRSEAVFNG